MNHLIGVDRRGGKNYQEVPCEICGRSLYISKDSDSGICAVCVQAEYPKSKTEIDISDVKRAIEKRSLKQYRKGKKLT